MLAGSIPKQLPLRGLRWSGPGVSAPRSPSAARRRSAPAASRYSKYRLLQRLDTAVYVLLQSLACRAKVSRFEGRQNRKVILRLGIDIIRQSHSSPAVAVTPHETEQLHARFKLAAENGRADPVVCNVNRGNELKRLGAIERRGLHRGQSDIACAASKPRSR